MLLQNALLQFPALATAEHSPQSRNNPILTKNRAKKFAHHILQWTCIDTERERQMKGDAHASDWASLSRAATNREKNVGVRNRLDADADGRTEKGSGGDRKIDCQCCARPRTQPRPPDGVRDASLRLRPAALCAHRTTKLRYTAHVHVIDNFFLFKLRYICSFA